MPTIVPFPAIGFSRATFDLVSYTAGSMLAGGASQVRQYAEPRWVGRWSTPRLMRSEVPIWRGFWDSMRGGLNRFIAFDPAQPYPAAYPKGFGGLLRSGGTITFDGSATVTALPADNQYQLSIGTLPPGFLFGVGDLVELRQGVVRGLFRIVVAAAASSGGAATLSVVPRINPTLFSIAGGVVAYLGRPSCIMVPDPKSWSYEAAGSLTAATFGGVQAVV